MAVRPVVLSAIADRICAHGKRMFAYDVNGRSDVLTFFNNETESVNAWIREAIPVRHLRVDNPHASSVSAFTKQTEAHLWCHFNVKQARQRNQGLSRRSGKQFHNWQCRARDHAQTKVESVNSSFRKVQRASMRCSFKIF